MDCRKLNNVSSELVIEFKCVESFAAFIIPFKTNKVIFKCGELFIVLKAVNNSRPLLFYPTHDLFQFYRSLYLTLSHLPLSLSLSRSISQPSVVIAPAAATAVVIAPAAAAAITIAIYQNSVEYIGL